MFDVDYLEYLGHPSDPRYDDSMTAPQLALWIAIGKTIVDTNQYPN